MKNKKENNYWNDYNRCYKEALLFNSRSEFKKYASGAYASAVRNNWIDDYVWFIKDTNFPYLKDNVYIYYFEETNSIYVGRTINTKSRDRNHLFDERDTLCKYIKEHNIPLPKMQVILSNLTIEEGLIYEDLLRKKYESEGYNILNKAKTGLYCGSIGNLGRKIRTYEECYTEAKKYKTVQDFKIHAHRYYRYALKYGWYKDYDWFLSLNTPSIIYNDYDKAYSAAKNCSTLIEFKRKYQNYFTYAKMNDWIKDYIWFKQGHGKWYYEECKAEAEKYKTVSDFRKNSTNAYNISVEFGWIKNFFDIKEKIIWNEKTCIEKSKECKTRGEFSKKYSGGYRYALDNNLLNTLYPLTDIQIKRKDLYIAQYELDGTYIKTYKDSSELKINHFTIGNIRTACEGKVTQMYGYMWRYVNDLSICDNIESHPDCNRFIKQYNLQGEYIDTYRNTSEIKKKLNIKNMQGINDCLNNKAHSAYNYIWKLSNDEFDYSNTKPIYKCINQYTKNGIFIEQFLNKSELKKRFNNTRNILLCVNGKNKTSEGYIWRYAEYKNYENLKL